MGPIQKEDQDMGTDPWLGGRSPSARTASSREVPDDVPRAISTPVAGGLALVTTTTRFGIKARQR